MSLKDSIERPKENDFLNGVLAAILLLAVLGASYWVVADMADGSVTIFHVFVAAFITAAATGFGAIPFLFIKEFDNKWLGIGNSVAAGLMLGASIGLVYEGFTIEGIGYNAAKTIGGLVLGGLLVLLSHKFLDSTDKNYSIGQVSGASAIKMLMIVGIMTVHSFAEGIGVGVSFGESPAFGSFISIAIAIHNIPEGLAISLILIPRGTTVRKAAFWSIFSSLPQPIMAVPAFLFVLAFKTYLPIGLGIAAGAMFWMVSKELVPDALEELKPRNVYSLMTITAIAMLLFQFIIDV